MLLKKLYIFPLTTMDPVNTSFFEELNQDDEETKVFYTDFAVVNVYFNNK